MTVNRQQMGGVPCIRFLRIPVAAVLAVPEQRIARVKGGQVRLGTEAPREILVSREAIHDKLRP